MVLSFTCMVCNLAVILVAVQDSPLVRIHSYQSTVKFATCRANHFASEQSVQVCMYADQERSDVTNCKM